MCTDVSVETVIPHGIGVANVLLRVHKCFFSLHDEWLLVGTQHRLIYNFGLL